MLKPSNRPRAPSAATLRVLYQLAYISSGAALGAGVLCAEERRRRTIIVQQIAENSRRLRQSPRYNHNAAATAAATEYRPLGLSDQDGALLAPDLPSVIEREYDRASDPKGYRIKRTKKKVTPDDTSPSAHSTVTKDFAHELRELAGGKSLPATDSGYKRGTRLHIESSTPPRLDRHLPLKTHSRVGITGAHLGRDLDFTTESHWRHPPSLQSLSEAQVDDLRTSLSGDLQLFFQKVSQIDGTSVLSLVDADAHASSLLRLAAALGHLRAAVSLALWKIAVGRSHADDMQSLAMTHDHFLRCGVPWDLHGPDGTRCTGLLSQSVKRLGGATSQLKANLLPGLPLQLARVLDQSSALPWTISPTMIIEETAQLCGKLADSGNLGAAVHVLTALSLSRWQDAEEENLVRSFFLKAIQDNAATLCDRLLKWTGGSLVNAVLPAADLIAYINMCLNIRSHALVRSTFTDSEYDVETNVKVLADVDVMDHELCRRLCFVFDKSDRTRQLLPITLSRLPKDAQTIFRRHVARKRAANLIVEWKSKRNFDRIWKLYSQYLVMPEAKDDSMAAQALHVAMVRVCLMANKNDVAQEAMSVLANVTQDIDGHLISLHLAANTNDWDMVDKLLSMHEHKVSSFRHRDVLRLVLLEYSHSTQDADEFLRFAFKLHDRLMAVPTLATHTAVLTHLALRERPDSIEHWLKECVARDWSFELSDKIVASVLRAYAVETNIDYSMLMGTGHELRARAPELADEHVRHVVMNAITAHVRKNDSLRRSLRARCRADQPWAEQPWADQPWADQPSSRSMKLKLSTKLAIMRLRQMEQHPGTIPKPRAENVDKLRSSRDYAMHRLPRQAIIGNTQHLPAERHRSTEASSETLRDARRDVPDDQGLPFESHEFPDDLLWTDGVDVRSDDSIEPSILNADEAHARPVNMPEERKIVEHSIPGPSIRLQQLKNEMVSALHRRQNRHVLRLYEESRFLGLEHAPVYLLPIAVDASLRTHRGDDGLAQSLVDAAGAEGANTAASSTSFYMYRLKHTDVTSANAKLIERYVMTYFKLATENAIRPSHHVANVAAELLFNRGFFRRAVCLLDAVSGAYSKVLGTRDVVSSTIRIKVHTALDDVDEICNTVAEALDSRRRIDQVMIDTLKLAEKSPWLLTPGAYRARFSEHDQERLRQAREALTQRQTEQRLHSSWFLPRLVNALVNYHCRVEFRSIKIQKTEDFSSGEVERGPAVVQPTKLDSHISSRTSHNYYEHLDIDQYISPDRMVSIGA